MIPQKDKKIVHKLNKDETGPKNSGFQTGKNGIFWWSVCLL